MVVPIAIGLETRRFKEGKAMIDFVVAGKRYSLKRRSGRGDRALIHGDAKHLAVPLKHGV
jgi:hypothetical protein